MGGEGEESEGGRVERIRVEGLEEMELHGRDGSRTADMRAGMMKV